jgi:glycerol uptake facilitator-like aquaporin
MMEAYCAEFAGTLFFLYVIISTGDPFAIGAALVVAIMTVGQISGGMFNPAVTIMMASAGKVKSTQVAPFIGAQVLGGLAALELHRRVQIL